MTKKSTMSQTKQCISALVKWTVDQSAGKRYTSIKNSPTAHLCTQKSPDKEKLLNRDKNGILKKYLEDNKQMFYQYAVPAAKIHAIMTMAHDNSCHNGFWCTYNAVKRHYFWRGMKKNILNYCKHCVKCNLYKTQKYEFKRKIFTPGVQPMEFISID